MGPPITPDVLNNAHQGNPHITMPLCVRWLLGGGLGATVWPVLGGRVGRSVGGGSGKDLSEEPVYQGSSRPRWIQSRPWVSSRTQPLVQLFRRRVSAQSCR